MGKKGNYRYTEDGVLLVRKSESYKIGAFDTMFGNREVWFPCSEADPDHQYMKMVFLGWFGYHKFQERKLLQGVFYLLTCGCFGVFYLYDLIAMLCGNYFFKKGTYEEGDNGIERHMRKIYYGPVESRKRGFLLLFVAVVLTVAVIHCLYQPVGRTLITWFAAYISNGVSEEEIAKLLWMMQ